jgi:hypothetical protein
MRDDQNVGGNRQGVGHPGAPAEESEAKVATRERTEPPKLSTDEDRARQNKDDPSRAPESGAPG